MAKPKIIVTRKLPDLVENRLREVFTVALNPSDKPFDKAKLQSALTHADGLIATFGDEINAEVLMAAGLGKAQIIANFGVGVNHIDLESAAENNITVTNTPGVLSDATADIAMALILNATRRTFKHETALRQGNWQGFDLVSGLGMSLQGKTLGILGMGRIGQAVACRAYFGFGMKIAYFNRSAVVNMPVPGAQSMDSIDDLMAISDVLTIHVPGGGDNHNIVSRARLNLMKSTAFLVNTARGDVVDQTALIEALQTGIIAGAGLDVFADEPNVPQSLIELDNVSLLPHIGSATIDTRNAMGMCAVDNLVAYFDGAVPANKMA